MELVVAVTTVGENSVPTEADTICEMDQLVLKIVGKDTHSLRLMGLSLADAFCPLASPLLSCSTGSSKIHVHPGGSCSEIPSSHLSTSR